MAEKIRNQQMFEHPQRNKIITPNKQNLEIL